MATPKPPTRESLEQQHPGLYGRLGKDLDIDLAERHGTSRQQIARWRRALKIPQAPPRPPEPMTVRSQVMRYLRQLSGCTSIEMARAMGTTPQTMSAWCTGLRPPTLDALVLAAETVGMELTVGSGSITVVSPTRDEHGDPMDSRRFDGAVA